MKDKRIILAGGLWLSMMSLSILAGNLIGVGVRKLASRFALSVLVQHVIALLSCLAWGMVVGQIYTRLYRKIYGITGYIPLRKEKAVASA
jgi:hypothetical protein